MLTKIWQQSGRKLAKVGVDRPIRYTSKADDWPLNLGVAIHSPVLPSWPKLAESGQKLAKLGNGRSTVGKWAGPTWSKMVQTTILVKMTSFRSGFQHSRDQNRPKWCILVHFGLKRSILVHLGPPTVLRPFLINGSFPAITCCTYKIDYWPPKPMTLWGDTLWNENEKYREPPDVVLAPTALWRVPLHPSRCNWKPFPSHPPPPSSPHDFLINLFLTNLVRISGFSSLFLAIAVLSALSGKMCWKYCDR